MAEIRAFFLEAAEVLNQRRVWWLAPLTIAVMLVMYIQLTDSTPRVTSFIYTTF
jgi:hypothetical protein